MKGGASLPMLSCDSKRIQFNNHTARLEARARRAVSQRRVECGKEESGRTGALLAPAVLRRG